MENQLIDEIHEQKPKRTAFLTVLCILTWIGAACIVAYNAYLFNHFFGLYRFLGDAPYINMMLWVTLINCSASLVSAAGSIYMWRMKKYGFYVYLIGQLAPLIASAYAVLTPQIRLEDAPTAVLVIFGCWFTIPVAFVVMYGTQLKHFARRSA
jgi:hypothetical protein